METDPRPAKLTVAVTTAGGEVYSWGPDEWNVESIPQAITYSTSMPGGYKTASMTLPRRIDRDYPDLNLGDHVEILGPGNKVLWEGRVQQLPRSHSDTSSVTVGCVGYQAHLVDDPTFREIYVSRDLGEWMEVSAAQRISWGTSFGYKGFSVSPDNATGEPALVLQVDGKWTTQIPIASANLDPGPAVAIAFLDYAFTLNTTDANFLLQAYTADSDQPSGAEVITDLATGSATGSGTLTAGKRLLLLQFRFNATGAGSEGAVFTASMQSLAWFGNHGLPIQGERPDRGVLASDVMADVLSRAAPQINFTTGAGGSITPTGAVIPHLAFTSPTTALDVVMKANAVHAWDWAIWEDKTFYLTEPDASEPWELRLSDGAQLDLEGASLEEVYNGVFATYPDASGVTLTVGPPGSGADVENERLADTSQDNIANAQGIGRKYFPLSISGMMTSDGAIDIAQLELADKALPKRVGQASVTGTITHPTRGAVSVAEVPAGQWATIPDHPADAPRQIIQTSYAAETDTNTLSFGAGNDKVDAVLERLMQALVGNF